MKKSFWCKIGLHKWLHSSDYINRTCKKCGKKQFLKDAGENASGMAPSDYWVTIKNDKPHN